MRVEGLGFPSHNSRARLNLDCVDPIDYCWVLVWLVPDFVTNLLACVCFCPTLSCGRYPPCVLPWHPPWGREAHLNQSSACFFVVDRSYLLIENIVIRVCVGML